MKAPLALMPYVVAGVLVVMDVIGLWRLPGLSSVNAEQNAQLANVVRAVESVDRPGMVSVEFSPTPTPPLSLFGRYLVPSSMTAKPCFGNSQLQDMSLCERNRSSPN